MWSEIKPIVFALTVPSVFGLLWFAYNHPKSYQRVFTFLLWTGMVAYMTLLGWTTGYTNGATAAFEAASRDGFDFTPLGFWLAGIAAPSFLFLFLLRYVHLLKDQ